MVTPVVTGGVDEVRAAPNQGSQVEVHHVMEVIAGSAQVVAEPSANNPQPVVMDSQGAAKPVPGGRP